MNNLLTQVGLFLDFVGCVLLLVDAIRHSSRIAEDYTLSGYPLFWKKPYFKNLHIKAFAFLAVGFALQFTGVLFAK